MKEREREKKRQRYACLRSFFCSFFFLPVVVNNLNAYRGECIYRMRVYLLHIIDIICISPLLSHLSLSLTFSSLFWSHSTGCHRPGPSCPCPLLYPFWDHVMWASTASCDDDHVDNLGAGEAVAFDQALCACRFSGFSEWSMGEGGSRGSCAFENLFVLHGVPFPIPHTPHTAYPSLPYPTHSQIICIH